MCKCCTERCYIYVTGQVYIAFTTPHLLKTKSTCCDGVPVVMVPLILAPVICFLCDNPRASQICSHLGYSTYKFCRVCMVSGIKGIDKNDILVLFQADSRDDHYMCWCETEKM